MCGPCERDSGGVNGECPPATDALVPVGRDAGVFPQTGDRAKRYHAGMTARDSARFVYMLQQMRRRAERTRGDRAKGTGIGSH